MTRTGRRRLEADDLLSIEYASDPAVSADGRQAAFVVSVADRSTGRIEPHVWLASTDAGRSLPLEGTRGSSRLPRFSPDGALYYLSDEVVPGQFQLWRREPDGTARRLTTLRHGASWYSLSPDGASAAVQAPLWPEETDASDQDLPFREMSAEERERWERERARQPIVVEQLMYKFDETHGIPDGSVEQVCLIDVPAGEQRLITHAATSHVRPVISPDGTRLAAWSHPHDGWNLLSAELVVIDLKTGVERTLTEGSGGIDEMAPIWLGDERLVYAAYGRTGSGATKGSLRTLGAEPSQDGPAVGTELLRGEIPWGPGSLVTGHTAFGYPGEQLCLAADGSLLLLSCDRGTSGVWRVSPEGGTPELLTERGTCVHGFAEGAGTLVTVTGTPTRIAEPYARRLSDGKARRLARLNEWMDNVELTEPEELSVPSPADDGSRVHGWLLRPPGANASETTGCVLDIHGGPDCCYPYDWWFEFHYLAARGLSVAWCDPHGSVSYGAAYQSGAWDGTAYGDLMAFLDACVERGGIDPVRLGVTGGSYGGFMTTKIIGQTGRFAAAVAQRNLCNRATSYGTGDVGTIFEDDSTSCYDALVERLRGRSSTVTAVDRVTTPTLVLHATQDYRCGFEQGEQLYHALKDRRGDLPVRFSAFPGENHGLTRDGNAWAQRGHLLEMADWFCRFLGEQGDAQEGEAQQ